MSLNDASNWRVIDPFPGLDLSKIQPIGLRAQALLARRLDARAVSQDFLRVHGVVDMLGGLDYHYSRIIDIESQLADHMSNLMGFRGGRPARLPTAQEAAALRAARFEAIAYLTNVGRLVYLFRSAFVSSRLPSAVPMPTLERLMLFRHKVTAHRSIDSPRGEAEDVLSAQALTLSSVGGQLYRPVGASRLALEYQIVRQEGGHETFVPHQDHTSVATESYAAFERLLSEEPAQQRDEANEARDG